MKNDIFPIIIEDIHRKEYVNALTKYRTDGSIDEMVKVFRLEQQNYMEQCEYFYQF
jgi:hypothetical protein